MRIGAVPGAYENDALAGVEAMIAPMCGEAVQGSALFHCSRSALVENAPSVHRPSTYSNLS